MLREGVKTEDELSQLRQRKKGGKKVEAYQRQQNDVSLYWGLESLDYTSSNFERRWLIHNLFS